MLRSATLLLAVTLLGCASGEEQVVDRSDGPVVATTATVGASTTVDPLQRPDVGVIDRVVDGDTVDIEIGGVVERVRLIGIDTPEPVGGFRDPQCYGTEASDFTRALLPEGTLVRLERDVEPRDDFDRLLAYVHRLDDDLFVNLALVSDGYAGTLSIEPNVAYADLFDLALDRARERGAGLWTACGGPDVPLG